MLCSTGSGQPPEGSRQPTDHRQKRGGAGALCSSDSRLFLCDAVARPSRNQVQAPHDAFRILRRPSPRVRHHHSQNPVPLDQLPRERGVLRARLPPGGRVLLLPRRATAPGAPLPVQRRSDRRRWANLLRPRRRGLLDARLGSGQVGPRTLRVPPRPRLHADLRPAAGGPGGAALPRPPGGERRDPSGDPPERVREEKASSSLLVGGVLPLECLGRPDQPPAEPFHRRGRDRGEHHLPHDRVPRTT